MTHLHNTVFFLQTTLAARFSRHHWRITLSLMILGLIVLMALGSSAAHAQTYGEQTIYSFGNTAGDGGYPMCSLTNVNGIFYGATTSGTGYGTLFSFDPSSHTEKKLYTFTYANGDGAYPDGGLTYDCGTGKLYGATVQGGANDDGMIYSLDPATGKVANLYSFSGSANGNGERPESTMVDVKGILYGTTPEGGASGFGSVYAFNASTHTLKTLYSFATSGYDADQPQAGLIYDSTTGKLYGVSPEGGTAVGTYGNGAVFSIDPSTGAEAVLYRFGTTSGDGTQPHGGLCEVNGVLYGTTQFGGTYTYGTLFSLSTNGTGYQTLDSFRGADPSEPQYPLGDLTYDPTSGFIFGTTFQGGDNNYGTVFALDPKTDGGGMIYKFQGNPADGRCPESGLLAVSGKLYGTTYLGGANDSGSIFEMTPIVAPVAHDDACTIKYNTARTNAAPGVLANDSNGGEGPMTATLVTGPSHGIIILHSDGSFTYSPNSGYVGTDSFTYRVANPDYLGNIGTVTLNIATTPTAHNDGASIKYNTARTFAAPGVLSNDDSGGSSPMTATLVTNVTHGTLSLHSDGSFIYTPSTGYIGTDSFTYRAANPIGQGTIGTVTLAVANTPTAHNDGATIAHNTARTFAAPGVLSNDDNGGASPLTAALVTNVSHGTLTLNSNGGFVYTPKTGYSGTDSFTYRVSNPIGQGTIGTVTLTVQ